MRKMTLKDIQSVSLEILKDVHSFCTSHNIRYSLAYGTLIGAIRHKGFIPWDDDIDIIMPRPDFERFCKEYNSVQYKMAVPGDGYIVFARVYDTNKTFVEHKEMPWLSKDTGIWIDVFPMDNVSNNKDEFLAAARAIRKLWMREFILRSTFIPLKKKSLIKKIKSIVKTILYGRNIRKVLDKHIAIMTQYEYGSTNYCSQLCCADNIEGEYLPFEITTDFTKVLFEGNQFMAFKEYDKVLSHCYGDYMQLPPIEKQVPKQDNSMAFYWK